MYDVLRLLRNSLKETKNNDTIVTTTNYNVFKSYKM